MAPATILPDATVTARVVPTDQLLDAESPPSAEHRTVFLARTSNLIWSGTLLLLESLPHVAVVGIAEAGAEATAALAALTPPPEVVITAPRTPELPVHELLPALRRACP